MCDADDTQLYVDFPRGDSASAADRIRRCVIDVKAWLASRCLLLNETKTDATATVHKPYTVVSHCQCT